MWLVFGKSKNFLQYQKKTIWIEGSGCSGGDKRSDLLNQVRETTAAEKVLQAESDRHQIRCG